MVMVLRSTFISPDSDFLGSATSHVPENTAVILSFGEVPFFRASGIQGHRIFQKAPSFWAFVLSMEDLRASFLFLLHCFLCLEEKSKAQTDVTCTELRGSSMESVSLRDR